MTTRTTHKFVSSNGTLDTVAAMNAGHDARTEALRELVNFFARSLKSWLQPQVDMAALGNPETRNPAPADAVVQV